MIKHRHSKPLPTEEYKFVVPDIEKFQLDNGLTVMLVERPNLPILRINLMTGCGSKLDPAGKKGLSNLMAMSIDEGADGYNALQLSNEFDILGSDFDIHSTNDHTYFLSRLLRENIERTFELISAVLLKPHFDDNACKREKRKVLTRLIQSKDDPDEIASNAFENLIFSRTHPYASPVIGKEEDIENISTADIKNFYNHCLIPSDSHLIIAGDIKRKEAERLAEKYLSLWEPRNLNGKLNIPVKPSAPGLYFIDKPGSVQSEIRMGHHTEKRNPNNYFPRLLLNLILGGQFSSRINMNLREDKGYTYGAFSSFNFLKDEGYFFVSTSVGQENTFNAVQEIRKELENIKSGVTEEELTFAKTSLMRKFPSNFETNGQVASSISRMIMYNLPHDHFKNYLNLIHQISIDSVNKAAAEYIKPEEMITLIVGSRNSIIEQFKGEGSLIELDIHGNQIS